MLKEYFKKVFNHAAEAATQEETPQMDIEKEQAMAADELAATLATIQEANAEMAAKLADVTAKYEAAQAALSASEDAQKMLVTQAAKARVDARTAKLADVMGKDNAKLSATLAAMEAMDDAQFDLMAGVLAASFEAEANSEMFKEKGVAAVETPEAVVEESAEMKLIKAMAANAAQ